MSNLLDQVSEVSSVKQRKRNIALVVTVQAAAAFLFIAVALPARQTAPVPQSFKPEELVFKNFQTPAPTQPIPYSHKKHLALGLECKFCHVNPEPRTLMTFPATSKCMGCHATIAKDRPAIQTLAQFAKAQDPIPWVRVYKLPAFVHWRHSTHLDAGLKCEMCHGQVAQMEVMGQATVVTSMYGCVHCHEMFKTKTGCDTCHN